MIAVWVIFLISLVPVPLTYMLHDKKWMVEPVTIPVVGVIALTVIVLIPYLFVRRVKNPDFILYVMSLFMFSSVIDLIIALEADGLAPPLMRFYMQEGEAYLWTAWGTLTNYWDATVHYGCCLWILYCVNNGKSYRKVGLFWVGSITNSVIVLVLGGVVGKFGVNWAVLLNIPYLVVPIWIGYKLMMARPPQQLQLGQPSAVSRLMDLVFVCYFFTAFVVDGIRAGSVLGSTQYNMEEYTYDHEPYLKDPVAFPKIQMLVYLFYFVPFYCCAAYGMVYRGQTWLPDWALLYAGAAAQGQFVHTLGAVHYKTAPEFLVPDRDHSRNVFWTLNILFFIAPILFALRENIRPTRAQRKLE